MLLKLKCVMSNSLPHSVIFVPAVLLANKARIEDVDVVVVVDDALDVVVVVDDALDVVVDVDDALDVVVDVDDALDVVVDVDDEVYAVVVVVVEDDRCKQLVWLVQNSCG
eukprot:gene1746-4859_t